MFLLAVVTAVCVDGSGGGDYRDSFGKDLVDERPLTGRRRNSRQRPSLTDGPGDGSGGNGHYPQPTQSKARPYPSNAYEPDEHARARYYDDDDYGTAISSRSRTRSSSPAAASAPRRPGNDVTDAYTGSVASRLLVVVSSGVCMSALSTVLMRAILNYSQGQVVATMAAAFALMSLRSGEVADLSKAMGVFVILVLRQSDVANAVITITGQVKAALSLSIRKPFPPTDNPWSYVHDPEQPGSVQFKMISCLLGIIFGGAFCGWSLARSIPLFPGWLGALSLAAFCGYLGTVRDPRGDLLRYVALSPTLSPSSNENVFCHVGILGTAFKRRWGT